MAFLWYCGRCNRHSSLEVEPAAGSRVWCSHCAAFGFMGAEYRKAADAMGREFGRRPPATGPEISAAFDYARMLDEGPSISQQIRKLARAEDLEREVDALRRLIWVLVRAEGGEVVVDPAEIAKAPSPLALEIWNDERGWAHVRATS